MISSTMRLEETGPLAAGGATVTVSAVGDGAASLAAGAAFVAVGAVGAVFAAGAGAGAASVGAGVGAGAVPAGALPRIESRLSVSC